MHTRETARGAENRQNSEASGRHGVGSADRSADLASIRFVRRSTHTATTMSIAAYGATQAVTIRAIEVVTAAATPALTVSSRLRPIFSTSTRGLTEPRPRLADMVMAYTTATGTHGAIAQSVCWNAVASADPSVRSRLVGPEASTSAPATTRLKRMAGRIAVMRYRGRSRCRSSTIACGRARRTPVSAPIVPTLSRIVKIAVAWKKRPASVVVRLRVMTTGSTRFNDAATKLPARLNELPRASCRRSLPPPSLRRGARASTELTSSSPHLVLMVVAAPTSARPPP